MASAVLLVGGTTAFLAASASPASADTATFTSSQVGTSGQTAQFNQSGNWQMAWSYDCSSYGSAGNFAVTVNQPSGDTNDDVGPNEIGTSGSGTDYYTDTGTFSLSISSECDWTITASPNSQAPASGSVQFSSASTGHSGDTAQFTESGNWQMAWTYDCSNYGSKGNFLVWVNQPSSSAVVDDGPNEASNSGSGSGSGTDYYPDTGTFSLSIDSECDWTINLAPNSQAPASGTARFSSTGTGSSGDTSEFTEGGNWQMAWSYDCSSYGSQGNFAVDIETPSGDSGNTGPNELGTGGSGTDNYTDTGTFYLGIDSECDWAISVSPQGSSSASPSPSPSPAPSPSASGTGYWMLGQDGHIYAFGQAHNYGDAAGLLPGGTTAVHVEPTPSGKGYWIVSSAGGVYTFGDARYFGGGPVLQAGESVVSLSTTLDGGGYWLFTNLGRVLPYGNAADYGDMSGTHLNGPVLDSVRTSDGKGYYMVGSDGGIFTFGNAHFYGSMGGKHLNGPVVGLAPTPNDGGYWLVANDGGIFTFGNAVFKGSMGGKHLNKPVIGMVAYGDGYLMVASDGGIFDFSSEPFDGSLGGNPPPSPIVGVAPLPA